MHFAYVCGVTIKAAQYQNKMYIIKKNNCFKIRNILLIK